jgi:hypothetical protein
MQGLKGDIRPFKASIQLTREPVSSHHGYNFVNVRCCLSLYATSLSLNAIHEALLHYFIVTPENSTHQTFGYEISSQNKKTDQGGGGKDES